MNWEQYVYMENIRVTNLLKGGNTPIIDELDDTTEEFRPFYGFVKKTDPDYVLQIGCGFGEHLVNICRLRGGFGRVAGCELEQIAVDYGDAHYDLFTYCNEFYIGKFPNVSIPEGKFDLIFTAGLLSHLSTEDQKILLDKMYSLTKKYVVSLNENLTEETLKHLNKYRVVFQNNLVILQKDELLPYGLKEFDKKI